MDGWPALPFVALTAEQDLRNAVRAAGERIGADERFLITDGYGFPVLDLSTGASHFIDRAAWDAAELSAAEVERRILKGEDRFEIVGPGGGSVVYRVPGWGKHPIRRLRVAIARWRHRRNG